jgi:hypothetical protein
MHPSWPARLIICPVNFEIIGVKKISARFDLDGGFSINSNHDSDVNSAVITRRLSKQKTPPLAMRFCLERDTRSKKNLDKGSLNEIYFI